MRARTVTLALALALVACGSDDADGESLPDGTMRIIDQSGGEFLWVCDRSADEECEIHRIASVSPELPPCYGTTVGRYKGAWDSRLFIVRAMCGGGYRNEWGRLLVCERDEDCAQPMADDDRFECRAGFCQNVDTVTYPTGVLRSWEMGMLCHGDRPRDVLDEFHANYPQDVLDAVDDACPEESHYCTSIPASCPDPG